MFTPPFQQIHHLKIAALIWSLFVVGLAYGQNINLSRKVQLDTLKVWMQFSSEMSEPIKLELDSIFRMTVSEFNQSNPTFAVVIDSSKTKQFLFMKMGAIEFVDAKASVLITLLDLSLVTGHIAMIKNYSWTLPLWPVLLPATRSKIQLESTPGLTANKFVRKMWINPEGYFKSKEKQRFKFKRSFQKEFEQLWQRFDKQNAKNLKK